MTILKLTNGTTTFEDVATLHVFGGGGGGGGGEQYRVRQVFNASN